MTDMKAKRDELKHRKRKMAIATKRRENAANRTENKASATKKRLKNYVAKTKRKGSTWDYGDFGKKFGGK